MKIKEIIISEIKKNNKIDISQFIEFCLYGDDGYYIKKPATQQTLAKALNTTFQQIGKYEKGQNRIPIVNLIRISKVLNKPLDYFWDINKETMIQSFIARMNNEMRK